MENIRAKIQGILMNSSQKSVIGWSVEEDDFENVAYEIMKNCFMPNVTKSFKIEVHNNSGAWYEIVLANSYLEAKMKVEKAYPSNTHVSLECEYDKPIF